MGTALNGVPSLEVWNQGHTPDAWSQQAGNMGASPASTDRLLGTSPTATRGSILQLSLDNTSDAPIHTVSLSYQMQIMTGTAQSELPGYSFYYLDGSTWTPIPSLDLSSNGTVSATFHYSTPVPIGGTMQFRWFDDNDSAFGPDAMLAIDNVSVDIPAPAELAVTPGNLVVERIGNGSNALNNAATPVFLDVFNPDGTVAAPSIALPGSASRPTSAPFNLMGSGTATSEGLLTRSVNGLCLQMPGYNGIPEEAGIVGSTNTRTIGVVKRAGAVDTSLSLAMFSGNNFRSIVSVDGTAFWAAGTSSSQGVVYVNGSSVTTLSTANARAINIFNNQLYYSTGKDTIGIYALGNGLPTSGSQSASLVIMVGGSPFAFQINPVLGVAYVADDRTIANGGGIIKYASSGGTWSSVYTLGTTTGSATNYGARGLTVDWTGANPIIYATTAEDSANRLIRIVDTNASAGATLVAAAPANTVFRGLDFAPGVGAAGAITQGNPVGAAVCANASGVTYTCANVTGATGYSWTVPAGTAITAGQGTPNITITWGSAGGDVTVTPTNYFGSGTASSLTVSVVDGTAPLITCATNKSVEYNVAWTFDEPGAIDPCGTNTITVLSTATNGTCGAGYVATRVWQSVNAHGNSATCTQVVTVVDTSRLAILCPSNVTVQCSSPWTFGTPRAADLGSSGLRVYDNSANDLATRLETGPSEVGEEIILAGTERYLEGFSYEFWSTNLTGAPSFEGTNVTVRLRFYANDGTNFNGYPTPGTVLYDSGEFWLGTDTTPRATVIYSEADLWLDALYPLMDALPTNFTWTVQFSGLGTNDQVGVDLYSPPVIGQSYGDFWLRTDGGWELRTFAGVAADIAAWAIASTNGVTISVLSTVTNAMSGGSYAATRTWRATDACGNFSDCSQTVTVMGDTAPLITLCPTNRSLTTAADCLAILPDFTTELVATDDCSQVFVSQSPAPGTAVGVGPCVITLTASDTASNASTCTLLLTVNPPPGANTNLSISEFMAGNTLTITDEDGNYRDWIELHNRGSCPVNLDGWSLTDDITLLGKWRFPVTNIAAGQFMIIWASDKDSRTPGAPLHTNFKLSEGGEYLALVQADGTIATQFYPSFPPQFPDVSYGLPAGGGTNTYLAWPTPGTPNSPGTNFTVADLSFTPGRGWYTNSFSVSVGTPTAGATIYYTTNGTVPGPTNGSVYTGPLVFANTTVLRAAAYRPGYLPASASHTYVFPDQVIYQTGAGFPTTWGTNAYGGPVQAIYICNSNIVGEPRWSNQIPASLLSLPTVSIAMNTEDLFGTNGIYSNPMRDEDEWERPCSVEYFRPDSQPGFQINCGIQIQGGLSRDPLETAKHNLRLKFKQMYGSGKLLFDLYPGSPVRDFDTLVLHASFNDHWIGMRPDPAAAQMQRDQWCADTQRETGGYGTHGTYVHLYLNGLYWGMYNLGERPDASYAAHYLGGQKSDYDASNGEELKDGTTNAWGELVAILTAGVTNDTAWSNVCHYLDVPKFIDYMLINFYGANQDWPWNNYWKDGAVAHGVPFHFFSWDAEQTLLFLWVDLTGAMYGDPGVVYSSLRQYPEFRRLFGDRAQQLLFNSGALTPERGAARWMKRAQEIDLGIVAESVRWGVVNFPWNGGNLITHDDWIAEQTYLLTNWFPQRTGILISQLRTAGMYPALEAPVFTPHGGLIAKSLAVSMSAPAGTVYYTTNGSDPRLPDGGLSPDARSYEAALTLSNSVQLRARAFATNTWSALVEAHYALRSEVEMQIGDITHRADGAVVLDFLAWPSVSYTLLAATNLSSGTIEHPYGSGGSAEWEAIATLLPQLDGTFSFVDTAATNYPVRFYRLTWP